MSQFFVKDNSSSAADIEFIQGNTGGPVGPDGSFTINLLGSGSVTVAGNPGTNTLTISVSGGALSWVDVTGTTQAMAVNTGYAADNAGLVTLTLPATSAAGSLIEVYYKGAGGWRIAQNAGQSIRLGIVATTVGVGGSISSNAVGDCIRVRCITADTLWEVLGCQGSPTIV